MDFSGFLNNNLNVEIKIKQSLTFKIKYLILEIIKKRNY